MADGEAMVDVVVAADVVARANAFPVQVASAPGVHTVLNIPVCSADDDLACNICDAFCLVFYKSYVGAVDDEAAPGHKNL